MNQGGGLQSLARFLVGEFGDSDLARCVVDQRQQPLGGGVSSLDFRQDLRNVGHERWSGIPWIDCPIVTDPHGVGRK